MHGDTLYSIGDLARRTGMTVKAIRFYSDSGIVPPTDRSPAGYRRYGIEAVARLDLVRTLRELGLDLATIRKVLDREVTLPEVAAAHAEALAVQIRTLCLRRAVLAAVAERGSTPEEMDLMHKLATLSEEERRRLIGDFLDTVLGGAGSSPAFAGIRRSMTPELPRDPDAGQVEAWVELAGLAQDPAFRAGMRRMTERYAAEHATGPGTPLRRDAAALVRDRVRPALAAAVDPASSQAGPVVDAVMAEYAQLLGYPDGVDLVPALRTYPESANDPRRDRYFELLSTINGWPAPEGLAPALGWFLDALRTRTAR